MQDTTIICKICRKTFSSYIGLSSHIIKLHGLVIKNYYDKYVKFENEELCEYCNKPTKFYNIHKGYSRTCSKSCGTKLYRLNMTEEQHIADHLSHVNAQNNRTKEQKNKTKLIQQNRMSNMNKNDKKNMYAKMINTRNNWSEEQKQRAKDNMADAITTHWINMDKDKRQSFKQNCKHTYHTKTVYHIEDIKEKRRISRSVYMKNKPFYNGVSFDSKWELDIYKYCIEHNIPIKREPISVQYMHNTNAFTTYPDFEIDGYIVEVKGTQFVQSDGTWINPYCKDDDGQSESKRQALIEKHVLIWYEYHVKEFLSGNVNVLYNYIGGIIE